MAFRGLNNEACGAAGTNAGEGAVLRAGAKEGSDSGVRAGGGGGAGACAGEDTVVVNVDVMVGGRMSPHSEEGVWWYNFCIGCPRRGNYCFLHLVLC